MFKAGHPGTSPESIPKLYEEVIRADEELKASYLSLLPSLREVDTPQDVPTADGLPTGLMPGLVLVCTAHKVSWFLIQDGENYFWCSNINHHHHRFLAYIVISSSPVSETGAMHFLK
jgi:hypothetical protein